MTSEVQVRMLPIASIIVPSGRRQLGALDDLEQSIRTLGLLNPITVTDKNRLVAGAHRLEVCKKRLKWTDIPATVCTLDELEAELAEIDENLIRNEYIALERCEKMARRKEIYLARYPETKQGAQGGGKDGRGTRIRTEKEIISFSDDTAKKAGVTARTVRHEVQIANAIPRDVRDAIRETAVADKKTELLRLAKLPVPEQRAVAEKIASGEAKGVKAGKNLVAADSIATEPPPLPRGPFRVIAIDPPWKYDSRAEDSTHRAANPYPPMSIEEISNLPVTRLAHKDSILWLWTTNAHLREAFAVLDAWEFKYKTMLTWVKDRFGTGDWLRGQTEHCLLAVRGKPTVTLTSQSTVVHGPLREHSRKPDSFYELVESLCPGSKVELFAREPRKGWVAHGNQTKLFS